jgi:sec-independent protein translocase protein TatA
MDGLSPMHLALVLAVVLIVFGPGRMPEVGAALGRSLRELRTALRDQPDRPGEAAAPAGEHEPADGTPVR